MSQTITDFKNGFNGGTRANRFLVELTFPTDVAVATPTTLSYHAVAAKLPEAELGSISIPYRGRVAHFAGDRDYKPWTVTILDDTGTNASWLAFQEWSNLLNSHTTNKTKDTTYSGTLLQTIKFKQLRDPSGGSSTTTPITSEIYREINLYNAWPSEVGQIGLDMGEGGSLISYSVTFTYDYYKIIKNA